MIDTLDPMPFDDALAYIQRKSPVGTAMDTAQWREVPTAIRINSTFSSKLTSVRVASRIQTYIDDFIAQDRDINERGEEFYSSQGRSEFVAKFREMMINEGFGTVLPDGSIDPEINDNSLRDLRSCRRLQLIFDTQVEQAMSYGQFLEGQDPDILDIFPCQRFIRVRPVLEPRDYHKAALGEVRRKDDLQYWLSLNRDFNVPWGPWGFGSGCGVEDVDRMEAEALGVIKSTDAIKPIIKDFNDGLQAELDNLREADRDYLANILSDVCKVENNQLTIRAKNERRKRTSGSDRVLRPGDEINQDQGNDPGRGRRGLEEDGSAMGLRVFDAQVARRTLAESWGAPEDAVKPVIDTATAQINAVIDGRKILFIEPLPEAAFKAIREKLPPSIGALYDGGHVIIYNKEDAAKTINSPLTELPNRVREVVDSGQSGKLLGYGADSLKDRPAHMVEIMTGGEVVCGFISSPDRKVANRCAMMRIQDFFNTMNRPSEYSFRLKYLPSKNQ